MTINVFAKYIDNQNIQIPSCGISVPDYIPETGRILGNLQIQSEIWINQNSIFPCNFISPYSRVIKFPSVVTQTLDIWEKASDWIVTTQSIIYVQAPAFILWFSN